MNKHVLPFGGYPIYLLQSGFYLNEQELNFLKNLKYNKNDSVEGLKISEDVDILKLNELERLKDFIKNNLNDYVSNVLEINNQFSFCQSWSTIQNKKGHHPSHSHPNHIISSVYYAKAKKTGLTFSVEKTKIQEGFYFVYDIKNNNIYNCQSYTVPMKTGDIIFFPGQIKHHSSVNNEEERIIVGSSFFVDGKIGEEQDINCINLTNNKKKLY